MVPRTPQENGVAECMNRKIMEHSRTMKLYAGLSLNMWVEVVNTAIYLINKDTFNPLGCCILEEA
jgi:hypothetical protein